MADKKAPKKDYDRWERTCVKVIKKPSSTGTKKSNKRK